MNILILGSGGREHALAWAVQQNPKCDRLICAPGNAGMAKIAECADLDIGDHSTIAEFCAAQTIDFVIIGAEAPLAAGLADDLRDAGLLTFGPSKAAARLESSKAFTKDICRAAAVPTAASGHFLNAPSAKEFARNMGVPLVVKADGLAAGKGVIIAATNQQATKAIDYMFDGAFGAAGAEVVIEEFMEGEEASLFVLCNGTTAVSMGTAQDHKRAFDGDEGPNTGGMGAYSPAPVLDPALESRVMKSIIAPTLQEMAKRGTPFQGVLYAGLMIKDGAARLVEFNVRFGDPECQVLCVRLGAQVLDLLLACAENRLQTAKPLWADDHALTVVMAAAGYPAAYDTGSVIKGLAAMPETSESQVFHAGTKTTGGQIVASGGRVLNVTARGGSLKDAQKSAYDMVDKIDWPQGFFRRDIGWRAL